jgi:hypothetical protein
MTRHTVVAALTVTVDFDIAGCNLQEIGTSGILTPLLSRVHGVSPPAITDDTPKTLSRLRESLAEFPGLDIQHRFSPP